ncbi:MAG: ABC transporter substrate-binding protein [Clostridia bacterium]|nr:ABC transporter substrate-binding protein [Clostridia bacterium]
MRKIGIKLVGILAVVALMLLPLGGCTDDSEKTTISLGEVTHSVFYAPQYVAMELGFFAEEGLEIELSSGEGADKVMAGVLSGGIDIGLAGPEAAIYVYNEGRDNFAQVFAQLTQRDGSFLVAREPDDNFSWDKLKGKHVLPGRVGGVPYMTLCHVLTENGLDITNDLTLDSSIQFALMTSAFTSGTGDYVTVFEPTASQLEANGQGYIVASVGEAAGAIPYTAYFASKEYLSENKDTVMAFTRAIYRGQQWVKTHTAAEIAEAVQKAFPDTDIPTLTSAVQSYKDIDAWCDTPLMTSASFDSLQEIISEAGELEKKAPYSPVVNTDFATAVIN